MLLASYALQQGMQMVKRTRAEERLGPRITVFALLIGSHSKTT
jgi:hypothetical protein